MKKLLYILLAVSTVSCDGKLEEIPANQLASNDFESVDGWMGDNTPPSLTKEKAHSGRYALKVGPGVEYSMGYNNLLSKLSASKVTKLKVRAWINLPNGTSQPVLVTAITDPNNPGAKPLVWEGLKLSDQVKSFNKWVEVEKTITFPATVNYTNKINVYLWRTGAVETALLDDLIIEKVE
ncbi:carbohydrate binding domain-containing protein [uncultured Hymenobacter sp.]|uniref:carbohydrate binding domain-containing protein n=1 Tax=uncultured Hymenobacter sp. TaxID=170016 RepID=UPI0035CBAC35